MFECGKIFSKKYLKILLLYTIFLFYKESCHLKKKMVFIFSEFCCLEISELFVLNVCVHMSVSSSCYFWFNQTNFIILCLSCMPFPSVLWRILFSPCGNPLLWCGSSADFSIHILGMLQLIVGAHLFACLFNQMTLYLIYMNLVAPFPHENIVSSGWT